MRLHINIDHVATVREARGTDEPDPVRAAVLAELGGADGITLHLREDRRHIQDRDVRLLAATIRTGMNFELPTNEEILALALEVRPAEATLVPERAGEITTEGGLALTDATKPRLRDAVERLREAGIRTALFVNPDADSLRAAVELGADAIELHTGEYASAWQQRERDRTAEELQRLRQAAALAHGLGLDVHAGHGLTYENVTPVAAIPEIEELNIGHSVISRAVLVGIERAVREMGELLREARRPVRQEEI